MNKRSDVDVRTTDTAVMPALPVAAVAANPPAKKSDEEKMHIVWRVFGGAIVSVTAFAGFTLYNTLTSNIAELRGEVSRLNEVKVEAAKKEDVAALRSRAEDNRRELDLLQAQLVKYQGDLHTTNKEYEAADLAMKKDLTAIEKDLQKALAEVREKIARLEGQQSPMKPPAEK